MTSSSTPLQQQNSSNDSAPNHSDSNSSQQAAAGNGFAGNGTNKRVSSYNASAHSKTDSKGSFLPAVPTFGGPVNGNAAVNSASFEHSRKASITISASGATGQLPNGGIMAGKAAVGGMPVFGSMSASMHSPSMAHTNLQSPGSLNPHSPNPRVSSPSHSPSPIPQPAASGGRPPSSLQSAPSAVSFGNFGPEQSDRQQRPSMSGMSSGSLTPNTAPVPLIRESSQQSNSDVNGGYTNGSRGAYGGGRGRGGYQGNYGNHQPMPYSPGPRHGQPNTPRTGGPHSQFPQGNRSISYNSQQLQGRPSPSLGYAQPSPGPMGMASPGMQGQPQYFQQQASQYFVDPNGQQYYGVPYPPYGMPPMGPQMGQQYYAQQSPRPHAMTPQQGQFMPNQYGQQPPSMSRTSSSVGERSASNVGQPPATPMTPGIQAANPPANQSSPAPAKSAFTIPKKTGGIKIVNPNTREAVKIEKAPESPAIVPSKSPANVASNPPPPSKTPDSHTRTDSVSTKVELVASLQAQIKAKLDAEKAEAEKNKAEVEGKESATTDDEAEKTAPGEASEPVAEPEAEESQLKEAKPAQETPTIVEPEAAKTEVPAGERELTEEDDEYWERLEAEEARKEEERERAYQEKKKLQDAEKAKKEIEDNAKLDEKLRKAEAEAEALEEAKQKKAAAGGDSNEKDPFAGLKRSENAFKATESPAAESSGVATPTSEVDTSMPPPSRPSDEKAKSKSKPAALKLETTKQVEAPTPSAALMSLRSARFLTRVDAKVYPEAIASPNPALNGGAPMGKFRYDKNFLMQFQNVFTEKPSETWSEKIKETVGDAETPQTSKGGRIYSNTMSGPRPGQTPKSITNMSFPSMGSFGTGNARGTSSKERFEASTRQASNKPYAMQHPGGFAGVFPGAADMRRTASSTSIGGHPQSPRNNPSRGGRGGSRAGPSNPKQDAKMAAAMPLTAGKNVEGLQVSESGWKPRSVGQGNTSGPPPGGETGYLAPDVVQRKVKSSLNKMTPTTFDKIAGQIIDIVMQSKQETDGRTLRQVIQLTFEKATDEAHWAAMYAEFCGRMLHSMTPEIKDETLQPDKNGNITAGNTLFRRYLLNRCQQDFEAGWKSKLPEKPEGEESEIKLLSDEYYTAAAAKRRGLGLVKFIGELYKLGMLTSRIMVMCVHRLLEYEGTPDEAEIESLSSLLTTIGEGLDNDEKGHLAMNSFFARIGEILKIESLPSRMRFMMLDLVDLRKANWKGKQNAQKGPATIDEIHAQAAEQERQKELQRIADQQKSRGGPGGGRMPMNRGDARFPGQMAPPQQNNTVGMEELRRLGNRNPSSKGPGGPGGPVSFGPTSMFNQRGSNTSARKTFGGLGPDSGATSRTATPPAQKKDEKKDTGSTNAFSALAALDGADGPGSPPSTAASPALTHALPGSSNRSKSPLKDDNNDDN